MNTKEYRIGSSFVAIDPGVNHCGWATFKAGQLERYGVIEVGRDEGEVWIDKAFKVCGEASIILRAMGSSEGCGLVIEEPQIWLDGSMKAQAAAQSGAVLKIAMLVGMCMGVCAEMGIGVRTLQVSKWKGQVPKAITQRRMIRRWFQGGVPTLRSDVWDAIGIGTYHIDHPI